MTMEQLIIYGGILLLIYLAHKYKKKVCQELLIAALISALWVSMSGLYNYTNHNTIILGINLFPFVAWTAGLVILREIYEKLKGKSKDRFKQATIIYIVAIIALEYIGYNWWGIQLNSNYQGLFGLELMHMPWWAQLYYLSIGPIFLKISDYMKVK